MEGKTLINGTYAKKTGKNYDGVTGYHNYHDLLANKDIDAVVISTLDHQHAHRQPCARRPQLAKMSTCRSHFANDCGRRAI